MDYEKIDLDFGGGHIQLELTNPDLIKMYQRNPQRVNTYILGHLTEAVGDIFCGEGLDNLISKIKNESTQKKIRVLKNARNSSLN